MALRLSRNHRGVTEEVALANLEEKQCIVFIPHRFLSIKHKGNDFFSATFFQGASLRSLP